MEGLPVRVTTFEPTETMSTYLLAFIVTDFIEVESKKHNLLVRYSFIISENGSYYSNKCENFNKMC